MGAVDDGVDLAIRAIGHLVRDLGRVDCQFAFLGDGEAFDEVTRLTRDLALSEWVTFTGWADPPLVQEDHAPAHLAFTASAKTGVACLLVAGGPHGSTVVDGGGSGRG